MLHLGVADEGVVGILEDEVVNLTGGGGPAHGVTETLLDLTDTLVASGKHTLVELGVQELGTGIESDGLGKSTDLSVGGGGVGHEGHGLLLVVTETLDDLGGVGIVVVRHIGDGNLGRIEVLEGNVDGLEGRLEEVGLLLHHTGLVGVEGEALAGEELLLELALVLPAAVLDGETNVGGVGTGGVGEDTASGLTQRNVHLLGLLHGVLTDKVLVEGLVGLGGHLDTTVHEVHLVDEEITEHTGARNDNVDTGTAKLLKRDELNLVDTAERIGNGTDTNKSQNLSEGLAVGLDVVGTPEGESNTLGELAVVLVLELLKKLANDILGNLNGSLSGDSRGVKSVHVTAGGENIGVTDGIATRSGHEELSVEELHDTTKLVVSDDLLEAELQVGKEGSKALLVNGGEASIHDGLGPGLLGSDHSTNHTANLIEHVLDLLDTAVGVGRLLNEGTDGSTGGIGNLGVEVNILKDTVVVATVDVVDIAADRGGNDTGETLDLVLGTVELGNVDESGNGLLGGGGNTDGVKTAGEQTALDLHDLRVDSTGNGITVLDSVTGGIVGLHIGKVNILVEVAGVGGGEDGVDNGRTTALVLAETLVRRDQLLELLQALVQTGILGGRSKVRDGGRVRTTLGNGGLRGVVGGVQVSRGEGVDQTIGVAGAGHTDLLTGHELQTSVGTEVKDGIGLEDLLQVGVVGGEAVVRTGRLGKEQTHRITLVTERRLDANEHITELLSIHKQILAVRVEVAGSGTPVLLEVLRVRGELIVLIGIHAVGNVEVGRRDLGLGIIEDLRHDGLLAVQGGIANVVSLLLELLEHGLDGIEHIKVGGGTDIALVRGEGEDGNGNLLVLLGLVAELGPLEGTVGEEVDTVGQRDTAAGGTLTSGVDNGLDGTIDLGKRHLKGDLDGVKAELGRLPLLEALEDEGNGAHVRLVELLEDLGGLGVVLRGGSTDEGEAGQVDDGINDGLAVGIVEVLLERAREVESTGVDGNDASAAALELGDERNVVGVVLGVDVRLLEDDTDGGGILGVDAGIGAKLLVVPLEVLLVVLEDDRGSDGVPDGLVGEEDGLLGHDLLLALHGLLDGLDVVLTNHEEERLEVLGGA